jgi:hypothetical protein
MGDVLPLKRWRTVTDTRVRPEHIEDPEAWIGRLADAIVAAVKARPGECVAIAVKVRSDG